MYKKLFFIAVVLFFTMYSLSNGNSMNTCSKSEQINESIEFLYIGGQSLIGASQTEIQSNKYNLGFGNIYKLEDNMPPVSIISIENPKYYDENSDRFLVTSQTPVRIISNDPMIDSINSGIKESYYRIYKGTIALNNAEWLVYGGSFSVAGLDTDYLIECYSVDLVNNKEELKSLIVTLDNTVPQATLVSPLPESKSITKIFNKTFPVIGSV